jgi:ribosome-associated toxin RatA of RatAB toxin-antitoxin module
MPRITVSATIQSTPETLFSLSEDYGKRLEWDVFMKKMSFLGGATRMEKGVHTLTTAYNGMTMETVFINVNRPYAIAMQMPQPTWFFKTMAGTWRFTPTDDTHTQADFIYAFTTRPRLLSFIMQPLIAAILTRDMRKRMACLKHAAETPQVHL